MCPFYHLLRNHRLGAAELRLCLVLLMDAYGWVPSLPLLSIFRVFSMLCTHQGQSEVCPGQA